jgi:Uma2 family endonuclease
MATTTPVSDSDREIQTLDPAILEILPEQGEWSEDDYLWLTRDTNRLVELNDGYIEVLPMPTEKHQAISLYLLLALLALTQHVGGKVFYAPLRMRVGPDKFREPDLLLVASADDPRAHNDYWEGADLVVEIVCPDDPKRDYVTKRADYAGAKISEYWIVDPRTERITVLKLVEDAYVEHGVFSRGTTASSALFPDFAVSVDAVLDA